MLIRNLRFKSKLHHRTSTDSAPTISLHGRPKIHEILPTTKSNLVVFKSKHDFAYFFSRNGRPVEFYGPALPAKNMVTHLVTGMHRYVMISVIISKPVCL